MLGRRAPGQYHFRLAGGFIADLHGRDLREEDFSRIWAWEDRTQLQTALESARRQLDPLVIEAEATTDSGASMRLEVMLTPLAGPTGAVDRVMGFYQPTSHVAALCGQPIASIKLNLIRTARSDGPAAMPRLRLAAVDGRRIA